MITNLKDLLIATGLFNTVELAEDLEPLEDFKKETPAVILYQGKTIYTPSQLDNFIRQSATKQVGMLLVCAADQVDDLEKAVVSTLIGYQHDNEHEQLEAVEADNHKITGTYYSRRIVFEVRTQVSQG